VMAFALIYLGIGVLVGSLVSAPLEGSLLVVFVFLLDAFAGPGMSASPPIWAISQKAADILIAAGAGAGSPTADWLGAGAVALLSLVAATAVFVVSARSRV